MNFGVSFALALIVALRARDVAGNDRLRLPAAVLKRFLRRPFEFFYPPKDNDPRQSGVHTVPPTH
jgi:site-specific recombinase